MRALLKKRHLVLLLVLLFFGVVIFALKVPRYYISEQTEHEPSWGVTFSKKYAIELDLDWEGTYISI